MACPSVGERALPTLEEHKTVPHRLLELRGRINLYRYEPRGALRPHG